MAAILNPNRVAFWYKHGLWSAQMVDEAVAKGKLTKVQADKIKKGRESNGS